MKYFLGIDNGLTAIKVAVFDESGKKISIAEDKTILDGDEINMELLWQKTASCIKSAVKNIDITAISVCGHGNGLYAVTKDMTPAFPAITSMTQRPKALNCDKMFSLTLQNMWKGQPAMILKWLKENQRENYDKIYKFMLCKDYIKLRLTGRICSDYTDMSAAGLLDNNKKAYSKEIFTLLDIEEMYDKLPEIANSYDCVGYITDDAAKETGLSKNTPVSCGAFDVNACVVGSYAMDFFSIISGTWGVNSALSEVPIKNKDILQCCIFADKSKYICIDSAPTSAVNLEWFLKNIVCCITPQQADNAVKNAEDNDILYLPYIYSLGQNSGGTFYGLAAKHAYTDMLKAVFEGVCFEHKRNLEKIKNVSKSKNEVVLSGGASNSAVWAQMFADVLEMPVRVNTEKQSGALGGAIMAAVCVGVYKDIYTASKNMVKPDMIYYPQKSYVKKYSKYIKLIDIMKGIDL